MNSHTISHRFAVVSLILMLSVGAGNTTVLAQPTTEHAPAESGDAGIADPAEASGEPEIAKPSSETDGGTSDTPSPSQTTSPVATTVTVTPTPAAADQGSTEAGPGTVTQTGPSEPSSTTSQTTPSTVAGASTSTTSSAAPTTPSTVGANKSTTLSATPSQSAIDRPRDTAPNAPSSPPGFVNSADSVSYVNRSDEAQYVVVMGNEQTAGEPRRVEPGETVTLPRCLPANTGCSFVATTTTGTQVAFHRSVTRGQAEPGTIALPPMTRGDGYGGGWAPADTGVTYTNRSGHDQTLVYGDSSGTVYVSVPAGSTLPVPCAAETRCMANVGVDTGAAFINEGFVTVDETGAVIHYGTGLGNGIVQTPAGLRYSNTGQYRTIVAFSANGELEQYATVYAGDSLDLPPCELSLSTCEYTVFQLDENFQIQGNATSSVVNTIPEVDPGGETEPELPVTPTPSVPPKPKPPRPPNPKPDRTSPFDEAIRNLNRGVTLGGLTADISRLADQAKTGKLVKIPYGRAFLGLQAALGGYDVGMGLQTQDWGRFWSGATDLAIVGIGVPFPIVGVVAGVGKLTVTEGVPRFLDATLPTTASEQDAMREFIVKCEYGTTWKKLTGSSEQKYLKRYDGWWGNAKYVSDSTRFKLGRC